MFLVGGVIITLTPPWNDDRKLILIDKKIDNTCDEVEGVDMVVTNDIIMGDKTGACVASIITSVNTTTTIVSCCQCCQCCQCSWCCKYYRCANAIRALKVVRVVGILGGILATFEIDTMIPKTI